jgi:hypothetical protein
LEETLKLYRITVTETQSPLFPLLPSVQIFFATFCRALFEAVQAAQHIDTDWPTCDTGRCIWLHYLDFEDEDD